MEAKDTVLVGCEKLCLTGDLIACPLPGREQAYCKLHLQYQAGFNEALNTVVATREYDRGKEAGIREKK